MMMVEKLRLALAVMSGRRDDLTDDELSTLGYDPYKFGHFGRPDRADIQREAEQILLDALVARAAEPEAASG